MNDDEMNRKMEFIVDWQAQFAADIQVLKERQDRLQLQQEQFQVQQVEFGGRLETLRSVADTALETSTRTAEVVTMLASTWSEAQSETQRQIARLASLLETHIREGHPPDASLA